MHDNVERASLCVLGVGLAVEQIKYWASLVLTSKILICCVVYSQVIRVFNQGDMDRLIVGLID